MSTNLHQLKEIFTRVKHHLLTQGVKSQESTYQERCFYRGPNATKCAVGCLIRDELYRVSLEGRPVHWCDVKKALQNSLDIELDDRALRFLDALQKVHDLDDVQSWEGNLDFLWISFLNLFSDENKANGKFSK